MDSVETIARYRIVPLRVTELWFRTGQSTACDLVRYFQIAGQPRGMEAVRFTTLCIDTTRPTEQVFSSFSSETRYEVRRAETRDGLTYELVLHPDRRVYHVLPRVLSTEGPTDQWPEAHRCTFEAAEVCSKRCSRRKWHDTCPA